MISTLKKYFEISSIKIIVLSFVGLVSFVGIWALVMVFIDKSSILSQFGPIDGASAFWDLMTTDETYIHITASLKRIVVGMLFAIVTGVPLGFLLGTISCPSTVTAKASKLESLHLKVSCHLLVTQMLELLSFFQKCQN